MYMECIINGTKIKYEDNMVWKFGKKGNSKEETWHVLKGGIDILKSGYQQHKTGINGKIYVTARILYKLMHPEWNIEDSSKNNTIDHIDINSLNNSLNNLRVANASEQSLNRKFVINAKGCCWIEARQKWSARIRIDGKRKYLGYFEKEADARQAYLDAVAKHRV